MSARFASKPSICAAKGCPSGNPPRTGHQSCRDHCVAARQDDCAEYPTRLFVCSDQELCVPEDYVYLLGQYLGDGCVTTHYRVPKLRVACADAYPGIATLVSNAITAVSGNPVMTVQRAGCSELAAYWPCLFPHYGPGRKHESTDLIAIFTGTLDQLGVRWRMCRPNLVAVSRRADVALLDQHIGPKH